MIQVHNKEYQGHRVFAELEKYSRFYRLLSGEVFTFLSHGIKGGPTNLDTYAYSSMQGTLESMKMVLASGRINDAYALLRKFYDSAAINIYTAVYLQDNFVLDLEKPITPDQRIVGKIQDWLEGKKKIPEYKEVAEYIRSAKRLQPLTLIFNKDDRFKKIRQRCNDHAHYNFYHHVLLNDNEVLVEDRLQWLESFSEDVHDLVIYHLGQAFFLNDHYMVAPDYIDAIEMGMTPEEGSEYWVNWFVQQAFNEIITPRWPDVTMAIKQHSSMKLD